MDAENVICETPGCGQPAVAWVYMNKPDGGEWRLAMCEDCLQIEVELYQHAHTRIVRLTDE